MPEICNGLSGGSSLYQKCRNLAGSRILATRTLDIGHLPFILIVSSEAESPLKLTPIWRKAMGSNNVPGVPQNAGAGGRGVRFLRDREDAAGDVDVRKEKRRVAEKLRTEVLWGTRVIFRHILPKREQPNRAILFDSKKSLKSGKWHV